jgi:hypothetical protein
MCVFIFCSNLREIIFHFQLRFAFIPIPHHSRQSERVSRDKGRELNIKLISQFTFKPSNIIFHLASFYSLNFLEQQNGRRRNGKGRSSLCMQAQCRLMMAFFLIFSLILSFAPDSVMI